MAASNPQSSDKVLVAEEIYNKIAEYYQLLFDDWDQTVEREAQRLDRLFSIRGVRSVLDCTCGTGLQCIGLARRGYSVTGVDSSIRMLRQARRNARAAGVKPRWVQADTRALPELASAPFDAAISCGNSLSHLQTRKDLSLFLSNMFRALRPGGWCLIDAWDYDSLMTERPEGLYRQFVEFEGHWLLIYDARAYGRNTMTVTFNVLRETARGWRARQYVMKLRAWRKNELVNALGLAGFKGIVDLSAKGKVELLTRKPQDKCDQTSVRHSANRRPISRADSTSSAFSWASPGLLAQPDT